MLARVTARRIPRVKSPSPSLRAIFTSNWSSDTSRCLSGWKLDFLPLWLDCFFVVVTIKVRDKRSTANLLLIKSAQHAALYGPSSATAVVTTIELFLLSQLWTGLDLLLLLLLLY